MKKEKVIALCCGGGGHQEQMNRLVSGLDLELDKAIAITDSMNFSLKVCELINCREVRDKTHNSVLKAVLSFFHNLVVLLKVYRKYNVVCVLSTGPGVSVFFSFVFKATGAKVIHIETWSRFYGKSRTGVMMYLISDFFYVQNSECLSIYPKARYSGRL